MLDTNGDRQRLMLHHLAYRCSASHKPLRLQFHVCSTVSLNCCCRHCPAEAGLLECSAHRLAAELGSKVWLLVQSRKLLSMLYDMCSKASINDIVQYTYAMTYVPLCLLTLGICFSSQHLNVLVLQLMTGFALSQVCSCKSFLEIRQGW